MAATADLSFERGLPASIEAERAILGAILLDNHSFNEAAERITADDFLLDSHRRIYSRMAELIEAGRAVDIVTLAEELSRRKEVESIGGVAYLASLTEGLPRRVSIEEYVRIVKDKSLGRQLIGICTTAITQAVDQSDDALMVLDTAESGLLAVSERGITRGFVGIPQIVRDSFGTIDNLYAQQREVTGLATHYQAFDKMTSGLQASDLIIIAARPEHGQDGLGHQHRRERGSTGWQGGRHLLAGNVEGVAAAPHAGLGGDGFHAEDSDRIHPQAGSR